MRRITTAPARGRRKTGRAEGKEPKLVSMVSRKGGEAVTAGLKGAWLLFEKTE